MLAQRRGSVLFTNTAAKAFVSGVLPRGSPRIVQVIDAVRKLVIDALISEAQEIIFTFVYTGSAGDRTFLLTLEESVKARHGEVRFVRLVCTHETLLGRIENPSRHVKGKLSNREILGRHLPLHDYYARYPSPGTIVINTDKYSADTAADLINRALPARA